MRTFLGVVSWMTMFACVACSSDGGGSGSSTTGGDTTSDADARAAAASVSAVVGTMDVPADFGGEPVKMIFGWGDKPILDASGKLQNAPQEFLPSLAGIPDPKLTAGQPFAMDLEGLAIPHGDHYVLVAIYVKGTAGTIPEKDKDWVAGSLTKISFTGAKVTLPAMELRKAQGI
jgi:hypothetical protein